jgi:hypothetical protein
MKNLKNFNEIINFKYQSYHFNSESKLLYFTKWTNSDRLCISTKLNKDILFHVHDANAHDEIHQIYNFLRKSIFMTNMKKKIIKYVTTCSFCQISKNSNQKSYEKLQFISISQKFLFEMSLNLIVKLFMIIKKNNAFLMITNRFFKYIKLISKIESFSTAIWVERYWKNAYKFWKILHCIVFDKDLKFTLKFWKKLFNKCDVKLNFITIYHFFCERLTKRFNQIVKIAFRCLLIKQYEKFWNNLFANVELFLNTSTNAFSEISSFKLLYNVIFKISLLKFITTKTNVDVKNFLKQKNRIRQNTMNSLRLIQTRMTMIFDVKQKISRFERKMFLKMTKSKKSDYHVLNQSSLFSKKLKLFKIVRKMNSLIYKLELSNFMKNHSIIFIIYLKQIKKNSFKRKIFTTSSSLIENDEKIFIIEKILKKKFWTTQRIC